MLTLGINYGAHDSSACLIRDGEVAFAVAEERLSRVKHDSAFPIRAIKACLDYGSVHPTALDYICFGWPPPSKMLLTDLKCSLQGRFPRHPGMITGSAIAFLKMWWQQGGSKRFSSHFGPTKAKVRFIEHHLAHAISAYAYSGFQDATVVIADGRGVWEATSVWCGHKGRLDHVLTIPWPNSLGFFYSQFTGYLGFQKFSDEWKVMGLAPYGGPEVDLREFIIPEESPYWVNVHNLLGQTSDDVSPIEMRLGPRRIPEGPLDDRHKNIAFAVQDACEQAMLSTVRLAVEKTKCRNLCLAGGVALNSKANGKILSSGIIDHIFVQPAASDDGVVLGAALAPYLEFDGRLPMTKMRHVYLGPEYSDDDIKRTLDIYKLRYSHLNDVTQVAAEIIQEGKILGWFQGRMEFGPRALGSRSILADPRKAAMKDHVNDAAKFRENWRPFAPSLLAEVASTYLEDAYDSPFMILTFPVKPEQKNVIPAVTHVDGSARVQTVEAKTNSLYWDLIQKFGSLTGVPVVMNTSFNLRGEPIVSSPTDAIRTFFSSGIDKLIIGNYLIEK